MTKDWLPNRESITRLYKSDGNSLETVQKLMKEKGFDASIRAYRSWLSKWGVTKYTRTAQSKPPRRKSQVRPAKKARGLKTRAAPRQQLQPRPRVTVPKRELLEPPHTSLPSYGLQKPLSGQMPRPQYANGMPTPPTREPDHRGGFDRAPGEGGNPYGTPSAAGLRGYGPSTGRHPHPGTTAFPGSRQSDPVQTARMPIDPALEIGSPEDPYPATHLMSSPSHYTQMERKHSYPGGRLGSGPSHKPRGQFSAVSSPAEESYIPGLFGVDSDLVTLQEEDVGRAPLGRGLSTDRPQVTPPARATAFGPPQNFMNWNQGLHNGKMEHSHPRRVHPNRKPLRCDAEEHLGHGQNQGKGLQHQRVSNPLHLRHHSWSASRPGSTSLPMTPLSSSSGGASLDMASSAGYMFDVKPAVKTVGAALRTV